LVDRRICNEARITFAFNFSVACATSHVSARTALETSGNQAVCSTRRRHPRSQQHRQPSTYFRERNSSWNYGRDHSRHRKVIRRFPHVAPPLERLRHTRPRVRQDHGSQMHMLCTIHDNSPLPSPSAPSQPRTHRSAGASTPASLSTSAGGEWGSRLGDLESSLGSLVERISELEGEQTLLRTVNADLTGKARAEEDVRNQLAIQVRAGTARAWAVLGTCCCAGAWEAGQQLYMLGSCTRARLDAIRPASQQLPSCVQGLQTAMQLKQQVLVRIQAHPAQLHSSCSTASHAVGCRPPRFSRGCWRRR
jgi:hypothetical protein